MTQSLRIVLAQLNLCVGDIDGNLRKHVQAAITARDELAADVIVFPELSLTGYPPQDLLLRPGFIHDANTALQSFISEIHGIHCVVSHPHKNTKGLYNASSLIYNGEILGHYEKKHLPNYGVFDENRYFKIGHGHCVVPIKGIPVGLVICEDLWFEGPVKEAASLGAKIIVSPNASPYEINKHEQRVAVLSKRAKENHVAILYTNNIGGQDDLIFDGDSMVFDEQGELCQHAGFFQEKLCVVEIKASDTNLQIEREKSVATSSNKVEQIYRGVMLCLKDYVKKNHFQGVIVGVSGGIDSALTLTIAVDTLGKENVTAVFMPSRFTADISREDAEALTKNLGLPLNIISIEPSYQSFLESLSARFKDKKVDVTEENIQARCRAILLMAIANKEGSLLLNTGNRSELAVGYCTLYGDMAGGFAVLKDIPKTLVYELAHFRNRTQYVIPQRTIERAPTAELAPNQKDEDSIPPYSILDKILEHYLNESKTIEEIVSKGFDLAVVKKIVTLIHKNEYKRQQSAVGPRINHKSFIRDWRYPISNGFKG